jgi:hypothetical protein
MHGLSVPRAAEQRLDGGRRLGPGEVEALSQRAVQLAQLEQLALGLDPFRHRLDPDGGRQPDDGADDLGVDGVLKRPGRE